MRPVAFFVCCWLLLVSAAQAATVLTNHYIITCRPGVDASGVAAECQVKTRHVYHHALRGFATTLTPGEVEALRKDKRILAVEPDGRVELCSQTIPAGVVRMGVDSFPVAKIDGLDERIAVDVAVIDSGSQFDHPDLNVVQSVDFTGEGLNGRDWHGHGTHVAGIIGALDNDFGIVGVAPGVRLWSVQVFSPQNFNQQSTWSIILVAFDYVLQNAGQISVLNCSFTNTGETAPVVAIRHAVSNLVSQGVVVVAGTGNGLGQLIGRDQEWGTGDDKYPAALPEVLAVSSINPETDRFAADSNYSSFPRPESFVVSPGGAIDVAAPGTGILSTSTNGTYAIKNGTSMACAHVSGLVALYIAENGRAHSDQEVYAIRQALVDAALPQFKLVDGKRVWLWGNGDTDDPDTSPEPLTIAWVAPVLTRKPQPQTAVLASNASFHAVAAGSPPLRYQWQFNGANLADNGRITGSESNVLSVAGVLTGDFGNYQIVVTNAYGSVTSALVKLSLPPVCVSAWPGLVAWWRAEGDALDSASTNHGTLANTTLASGKVGQAFELSGWYSKVTVPTLNFSGRNAMTIEGWIKPMGLYYQDQAILQQDSVEATDWVFKFKLNRGNALLSFGLNAGGAYDELNVPVAASDFDYRDGNWHHVAATYDGSARRIYKDGVEIGAGEKTGNIAFVGNQQVIGGYNYLYPSADFFIGLIDELAIFDRALSPSEIESIYTAGGAGKCIGPPLPFLRATRTNGVLVLTWSASEGRTYQLQSSTNLAETNWVDFGAALLATNSTANAFDIIGPDPQRFYRVLLEDPVMGPPTNRRTMPKIPKH